MYDYVVALDDGETSTPGEPKRAMLCGDGAAFYLIRKLVPQNDLADDVIWCVNTSQRMIGGERLVRLAEALSELLVDVREHPETWREQRGFDGLIYQREGRLVPRFFEVQRSVLDKFLTEALEIVRYAIEHERSVIVDGGR